MEETQMPEIPPSHGPHPSRTHSPMHKAIQVLMGPGEGQVRVNFRIDGGEGPQWQLIKQGDKILNGLSPKCFYVTYFFSTWARTRSSLCGRRDTVRETESPVNR